MSDPKHISEIVNIADVEATVKRVTGKTLDEWEEVYWQRRKKWIDSRLLTEYSVFLNITNITSELGLDGDDFEASWHRISHVIGEQGVQDIAVSPQQGMNRRYLRAKHHLGQDDDLEILRRQGPRNARRMIGWKLNPKTFETIRRAVNVR